MTRTWHKPGDVSTTGGIEMVLLDVGGGIFEIPLYRLPGKVADRIPFIGLGVSLDSRKVERFVVKR